MRIWHRIACVGGLALGTAAACTMENATVPSAQLMQEFQAGQPMLNCRTDCSLSWGNNREKVKLLDATGQWQDLALLVMQIGYMDDLSYYYLGRAAENLGYLQAAQRYYRIAERISVTQMSCRQGEANVQATLSVSVNLCDGYDFPDALYPHLQVVESRLAELSTPSEPTPSHHVKKKVVHKPSSTTAASASGSGQAAGSVQAAGSGFVVPTPTAAPAGGSGFVQPAPTADPFAIPTVTH
jgi:hypothetical protein